MEYPCLNVIALSLASESAGFSGFKVRVHHSEFSSKVGGDPGTLEHGTRKQDMKQRKQKSLEKFDEERNEVVSKGSKKKDKKEIKKGKKKLGNFEN